jgi:hypothetical protein
MRKQQGYVRTTEQWVQLLLLSSGFEQKEHGHHHHRHVMMPGQPTSNLIMIHSGCCFGKSLNQGKIINKKAIVFKLIY